MGNAALLDPMSEPITEEWLKSVGFKWHQFVRQPDTTCGDVIALVEAITGQPWDPENHLYGSAHTPERVASRR